MSYDIIYQKRFVKIGDKIAPLVLMGCNNVTEFRNGREVLERDWWPLLYRVNTTSYFCCSEDELIGKARDMAKNDGTPSYELFKYGSKWYFSKDLEKFYSCGIKTAKTLEEYKQEFKYKNAWDEIGITLSVRDRVSGASFSRFAMTDQELLEAVDAANSFCEKLEAGPEVCDLRIRFGFACNETLEKKIKRPKKKKTDRPETYFVVQNQAGNYFVRLTKYGYLYSPYTERAKWFRTKNAAEKWVRENSGRITLGGANWNCVEKHTTRI